MKQSRSWKDWDNSVEGFTVDEHGWVTELKTNQTAGTVFYTPPSTQAMPFTRVIVMYEGQGEIQYSWSASKVAAQSAPGRDVVNVGSGSNLLKIVSVDSSDYLRNIRIIPERYLDAYEAGEIFNPDFVARLTEFNTVRFMDWMKTNNDPESVWAERSLPEDRTWTAGGVPLEVMIQLANTLDANPWFNIPHLADETYITNFATMVKQQLADHLTVYVEHSNEVWNWGYEQAQYANTTGRARWGEVGNAFMQWHGMRTAQICDGFKLGPFTDETSRVKCVLGVQTGYHGLQNGAVECPLWVAEGNQPCYTHGIDYLGLTTYFSAGLIGPRSASSDPNHEPTLRAWFEESDGGLDKAFAQMSSGTELRTIEGLEDYQGVAVKTQQEMAYWSSYAEEFGLGLVAYEGGQHISANGLLMQDDQDFIDFHIAINRDPRITDIYRQVFQAWKNGGGELHVYFVDFSTPSKWGSWGALEYLMQESSPKWDAILEFNRNEPCWWLGCP